MIILNLVERELRARSKRRSTYYVRWGAAVMSFINFLFAFPYAASWAGSGAVAYALFLALTGCAFLVCLGTGVFLTSDCLSEEKRDGTLPLLFLAGLKGYEVVLGKFVGRSLDALYALLAFLPATAVTFFMGGVTLADFLRTAAALVNALFFSLAAGICVSAFVRKSAFAIGITLGLLVVAVSGPPMLVSYLAYSGIPFCSWLAWPSPFDAITSATDVVYAVGPSRYWGSLAGTNALAWLLLAISSASVTRQSHAESGDAITRRKMRWQFHPPRHRRKHLLVDDPVRWLLGDAPVLRFVVWSIVVVWGAVALLTVPSGSGVLLSLEALFCAFSLKCLVAFQACRFFSEARQNGTMELLLSTPLCNSDLIRAQWRALRRVFLLPVVIFLVSYVAAEILRSLSTPPRVGFSPRLAGVLQGESSSGLGLIAVMLVADGVAVGWFGMWLALTIKRPIFSTPLAVFCVLLAPSMLTWLGVIGDMLFISWSTTQLTQDFRLLINPVRQPSTISQVHNTTG